MSLLVPRRIESNELLDEHDAPFAEMRRSLLDLRRINRYLGGVRAYRLLLRRFFGGEAPAGAVVVDVGTGTSDLLQATVRHNRALRAVGVDFKIDHLLFGRELQSDGIHRIVADARMLPFRDESVDVVTSAHFFHHFTPEVNSRMVQESLRIARRGVVFNDTVRHRAPLALVRLLALLRLVGPITRVDAPASVLQGYTVGEVRDLLAGITARKKEVVDVHPYRFGLLVWK